jgi:copper(I)-binding protein
MARAATIRVLGWLACGGAIALLVAAMLTGAHADPVRAAPRTRLANVAFLTNVRVTLPVVPGRPAAGYFVLSAGTTPVELLRVTSAAKRTELHAMNMTGGVMRMDALTSVRVAPGHVVRFAPGGAHLMLFDLPANIRPGATLPITFIFADGTRVRVAATVSAGIDAAISMAMPNGAH